MLLISMFFVANTYTLSAKKEIILSAGSINTPQLLMLSGIGNPSELKKLGIKPVVALPEVGQNLVDHPLLTVHFQVNTTDTIDPIGRNATLADELLVQWNTTGTGQFTDPGANQIVWARMPNDSSVLKHGDPSAGPNSPHFELLPVVSQFSARDLVSTNPRHRMVLQVSLTRQPQPPATGSPSFLLSSLLLLVAQSPLRLPIPSRTPSLIRTSWVQKMIYL